MALSVCRLPSTVSRLLGLRFREAPYVLQEVRIPRRSVRDASPGDPRHDSPVPGPRDRERLSRWTGAPHLRGRRARRFRRFKRARRRAGRVPVEPGFARRRDGARGARAPGARRVADGTGPPADGGRDARGAERRDHRTDPRGPAGSVRMGYGRGGLRGRRPPVGGLRPRGPADPRGPRGRDPQDGERQAAGAAPGLRADGARTSTGTGARALLATGAEVLPGGGRENSAPAALRAGTGQPGGERPVALRLLLPRTSA